MKIVRNRGVNFLDFGAWYCCSPVIAGERGDELIVQHWNQAGDRS